MGIPGQSWETCHPAQGLLLGTTPGSPASTCLLWLGHLAPRRPSWMPATKAGWVVVWAALGEGRKREGPREIVLCRGKAPAQITFSSRFKVCKMLYANYFM